VHVEKLIMKMTPVAFVLHEGMQEASLPQTHGRTTTRLLALALYSASLLVGHALSVYHGLAR